MRRLASTLLAAAVLLALAAVIGTVLWQRMAPPDEAERLLAERRAAEEAGALARLTAALGRPLDLPVISGGAEGTLVVRAAAEHAVWPVQVGVTARLAPLCAEGGDPSAPACWAVETLLVDGAAVEPASG